MASDAPLALLRLAPDVLDTLDTVGVRTIGQFAQLPASGLADRFGDAPFRRLQLALGRVPERLPSTVVRGPVRATIAFDGPTSQAEAVRMAAQQCVQRLAQGLLRRRLGTLHLRVSLDRAHAPATTIDLRLARATRRAEHLWRLMQPHLERVHLGHDPAQGVQGVRITSLRHATLGLGQWKLIEGAAALDDGADPCWGEWLDQMRRRLGPAAIRVPHAQADPSDERAWQAKVAEGTGVRAEAPAVPVESLRALRPTMRVAPAQAAEVQCDARRRPVQLRIGQAWLAVSAHDGPERVSAAWWRDEHGTCDHWRVLAGGAWWWLRREGAAWWLEGAWS
jgi:protein ImuB